MAQSSQLLDIVRSARRSFAAAPILAGLLGCGDAPDAAVVLSGAAQPILGGRVDSEHPQVMLLVSSAGFLCTGTVIHAGEQRGFLLTAAHCATNADGTPAPAEDFTVVAGADFATATRAFGVEGVSVEPGYDALSGRNDIAVVRFSSDGGPLPVIPVLGPEGDALGAGDAVLLVGYGQTEGAEENTERRQVARTVLALDEQLVVYSQEDARGACFGDSGGPVLVEVGGQERVAAVISGGIGGSSDGCTGGLGLATRASAHAAFIGGALLSGAPG